MSEPDDVYESEVEDLVHWAEEHHVHEELESPRERSSGSSRDLLTQFRGYVPTEAIAYVEKIARTHEVRFLVLERLDAHVCRRLPSMGDPDEARRRRWERSWQNRQESMKSRIRRERDIVVRNAHCTSLLVPSSLGALPKKYLRPKLAPNNDLWVWDPRSPQADLGNASYLEHTPGEVVRFAHKMWDSKDAVNRRSGPDVWDLTAGSGTVERYFSILGRGRCISTDIVTLTDTTIFAPAQEAGRLEQHSNRPVIGRNMPLRIAKPDLVFLDPPSLGTPTHADIYQASDVHRDLASLLPIEWVEAVVSATRRVAHCLAPGGMISLLVRHGHRKASHVEAVPELLDAVVDLVLATEKALGLRLLQSNPIAYGNHRLNQPGLGQSRVPATHLLLGRSP